MEKSSSTDRILSPLDQSTDRILSPLRQFRQIVGGSWVAGPPELPPLQRARVSAADGHVRKFCQVAPILSECE